MLQTVWLTLVRKADSISEPQAVLQWMVVTARREAWRVAKSAARVRPEDLESAFGQEQLPSGESVEDDVVAGDVTDPAVDPHPAAARNVARPCCG